MEILGFLTPAGRDSPSVFGIGDVKGGILLFICHNNRPTIDRQTNIENLIMFQPCGGNIIVKEAYMGKYF